MSQIPSRSTEIFLPRGKKVRSKGRFNGIRLSLHSAKRRSKQGRELDFALQLGCNETRTQRLVQMGEWEKQSLRGFLNHGL